MQNNNAALSAYLRQILSLASNDPSYLYDYADDMELQDDDYLLSNANIIDIITQLNVPAFVSIDASLQGASATTSINIIVPDVHRMDINLEWQDQPAKEILTRVWKLPSHWGTGQTCINMAEAIGFILGEI